MSPAPNLAARSAFAEAMSLPLPQPLALPQVSSLQSRAGGCRQGDSRALPGQARAAWASCLCTGAQAAWGSPAWLAQGNLVLGRSLLALRGCVHTSWTQECDRLGADGRGEGRACFPGEAGTALRVSKDRSSHSQPSDGCRCPLCWS